MDLRMGIHVDMQAVAQLGSCGGTGGPPPLTSSSRSSISRAKSSNRIPHCTLLCHVANYG